MAWFSLRLAMVAIATRATSAWAPGPLAAARIPNLGIPSGALFASGGASTMFGMDNAVVLSPGGRAFLVGATIKQDKYNTRSDMWGTQESLDELGRLCETAGLVVAGREHQTLQHPAPATFIGAGKLAEVKAALERLEAEGAVEGGTEDADPAERPATIVVFDEELSPAQGRNLGESLGVQVLDRTQLILQIFGQRARSREAKLQVQSAQLRYMLPRLNTFMTQGAGMDSKGGGGGGGSNLKGMGEKQVEVDRRLFRKQIQRVEAEMDELRARREEFREKRRKRDTLPVVAIVGYTNAGKSSLLNRLCEGEETYADDLLFATLDPTTRKVALPGGREVLFSDTVGFIQKLPTRLVQAFLATLEELRDADLVLHVVDAASPRAAAQVHAVQEIVGEEGAGGTAQILALNKADAIVVAAAGRGADGLPTVAAAARAAFGADADGAAWAAVHPAVVPARVVAVSAKEGRGLPALLAAVEESLRAANRRVEARLPYSAGDLLAEVHRAGTVLEEEFGADGTRVVAYVPPSVHGKLRDGGHLRGGGEARED